MINKTALGDCITGLVCIANSIPRDLCDANGDNLRDAILQGLHDIDNELDLGREINWEAQGNPQDILAVDRPALAKLQATIDQLTIDAEELPEARP